MRPRKYTTAAERQAARVRYNHDYYARRQVRPWRVDDLYQLIAKGQRFACLYVDPPWGFDNKATRAAAEQHYATMTLDELRQLPLAQLASRNAHLHLWTTNGLLPEALLLLRHWGFPYTGSLFVWCKPHLGMGNYWRSATEILLLGMKGKLPFQDKGQRNWLECPRGTHSRKPDHIRTLIEQVSPGPYLELFARELTPGWTAWGNDITPSLLTPGA